MLIMLIEIFLTKAKKSPPWVICMILSWMAFTLARLRDTMDQMGTDLRVQTSRLDDHIRFSCFLPAPINRTKSNN